MKRVRSTRCLVIPMCLVLLAACGDGTSSVEPSFDITTTAASASASTATSTTVTSAAVSTTSSITAPVDAGAPLDLTGLRWVTHGVGGGIVGDDGRMIWATSPMPADVGSDHAGGLVFTDSQGLFWFPAGATSPTLVLAGGSDLVRVDVVGGAPVAVLATSRSGVRLTDGARVVLSGSVDRTTIEAPNGLVASVSEPEYAIDAEGLPVGVVAAARLRVTYPDRVLMDIQFGSAYETWPVLHDFDGRFIIASRGPLEPAAGEETFFVIDLSCADCLRTFVATATRAALVTESPVDLPQIEAQELVRGSTILTDADVTSLGDGQHLGYLSATPDRSAIGVDLAVWFSGNEANLAAIADGSTEVPVPNDYYIRNVDGTVIAVGLATDVAVTSVWFGYETDGNLESDAMPLADLLAILDTSPTEGVAANIVSDPWWVTVRDGVVVALDEQYVP